MFTRNDLFDIAVKMEENGKAVYCRAMEKTKDNQLLDLLQWMADEEECHGNLFSSQKKALPADDLEVMLPDVLKDMMGKNSLSLDEVDFGMINTPEQMLKTFIMFENDTVLFYEFLDTFIESDTTREGMEKIIKEEIVHVEKLTLMIQSIQDHPVAD